MKEIQLTDSAAPLTTTLLFKYGWKCAYLSWSDTSDNMNVELRTIRLARTEILDIKSKIEEFFSSTFFNVDDLKEFHFVLSEFDYTRAGKLVFKMLSPEEFYIEDRVFDDSDLNTKIVLTRNELFSLKSACEEWLSENHE